MHFFLVSYIVQFSFLGQFQGSVSLLRSGNASASYTKHHWTMCYRKIWNPQGKNLKNWCWWLCMCDVNSRQNKEFLFCSDNQISLKNVFVLFSRNLFFFFMRWSEFFFLREVSKRTWIVLLLMLVCIEWDIYSSNNYINTLCQIYIKWLYYWCLNYGKVVTCLRMLFERKKGICLQVW